MREVFNRHLELYHLKNDEVESMSDWAKREQLYNCELFYEQKFKIVKKAVTIIRTEVADILRGAADKIDPGLTA